MSGKDVGARAGRGSGSPPRGVLAQGGPGHTPPAVFETGHSCCRGESGRRAMRVEARRPARTTAAQSGTCELGCRKHRLCQDARQGPAQVATVGWELNSEAREQPWSKRRTATGGGWCLQVTGGADSTQGREGPHLPSEPAGGGLGTKTASCVGIARFPLEREGDRLRSLWLLVTVNLEFQRVRLRSSHLGEQPEIGLGA